MSRTELFPASKLTVRKGCARPRMVTFMGRKNSARLGFQLADFRLDLVEGRLGAEFFQVGIFGEPAKIAVAELQGGFERGGGPVKFFSQRIAAREIVEDQRILRL